jgi:HK97 family phage major capsid protein
MAEKDPVQEVMGAFEEFRKANDENQKKHSAALDEKIDKINKVFDKYEPMNQQLVMIEKQNKAMQEQLDSIEKIANRSGLGGVADPQAKAAQEYLAAFDRMMRRPSGDRDPADVELVKNRSAALVKGDDASAGYLLAPPEMQKEIIKNVIEMTPMRSLATVRTIGGDSWKSPKKTGSGSALRVGERAPRANTGDSTYGMLTISAPEMFARIEVSQQMLEDSDYDLSAELREDASEQFSVREGAEYVSGVGGTTEAAGFLLDAAGLASFNSGHASQITGDGLIDLFHGLKTAYAKNGIWTLNRSTLGAVRKLKDGNGQYLWVPGIANGIANTILGAAYAEMSDMPNIAANAYPIAFADWKKLYVIIDRVGISFQPDYMTGADDGLVVFRGRKRTGGGVRQAEAGVRLKVAA